VTRPTVAALVSVLLWAAAANAGSLFDPALRFRQLRTEHFVIYFHQGEERLAQRLGPIAEETWQLLRPRFSVSPPGLTRVILADQTELWNGYATPVPRDTIVIYAVWPSGSELAFDDCRLPGSALIGEEGRAFYYISAGLERARAHTAARSIGLARGALEDAIAYAQERRQFGQAIGDFQNTRFRLARMATDIEAARQLMYFVCDEIDQKRRCDKEAAMVKLFASEMAERVTSEALQVFGGAGYTTLHAVERYWRDARLTKIFEGTSEIQQRIISDHLLGKSRA